jgi:hypothetical protein
METATGLFVVCMVMLGLWILASKIIAAWRRFVNGFHGEDAAQPALRRNPVGPGIVYYRTRNGRSDYRFRIERVGNGGYRAYILEQPAYNCRGTDNHVTHRLSDSRGHYICWTKRLDSPEEARKVAAFWADKTEDYIVHGRPF